MAEHDQDCLCRPCHERRRIECFLATSDRQDPHQDHRVPECVATPGIEQGATAVCRTCEAPITWTTVEEPGHQSRTGWSDNARRDAIVCFRALDYAHVPDRMPATTSHEELTHAQ
jgi:hypothetical protein